MKICQISTKNQAFLLQFLKEDVKFAVYGCKNTKLRLLEKLVSLSNRRAIVHVSQSTLGKWLGIGRQRVNQLLSELESLGVLARKQIGYSLQDGWRPCLYTLSPYFYDMDFRTVMSRLIPSLAMLSITLLIPGLYQKCDTINNKDLFNNMYVCMNYEFGIQKGKKDIQIPKAYSKKEGSNIHTIKNNQKTNKEHMVHPFPQILDELSELRLTQAGKIKLCAFPEHILLQAKAALKNFHKGKGKDLFPWFYVTCKKLCEQASIELDKGKVKFLQSHFNINWFDDDFIKNSSSVNEKEFSAPQIPKVNNNSAESKFDTQNGVTRPGSVPFKRNAYEERRMAELAQRRHDKYGPGKDWKAYEAQEKAEYERQMEELVEKTRTRQDYSPAALAVRKRSLDKGLHPNFAQWHDMFPIPQYILDREKQEEQLKQGITPVKKDKIIPQSVNVPNPPTTIDSDKNEKLSNYLQQSSKNFTDEEWKYIVQRVNDFGYQFVPDHIKQWWKEHKNEVSPI